MDKDFHYYGTYVAALLAGYPPEQAQTIAHAAQYVDDSTSKTLVKQGSQGMDFQPIPTYQITSELEPYFTGTPEPDGSTIRQVWVPFHFLPGNYTSKRHPDPNAQVRIKDYTASKDYKGKVPGNDWH